MSELEAAIQSACEACSFVARQPANRAVREKLLDALHPFLIEGEITNADLPRHQQIPLDQVIAAARLLHNRIEVARSGTVETVLVANAARGLEADLRMLLDVLAHGPQVG